MKWGIVIFVWIAWGCQHEPEPWTEEGRGIPVFVRAGNGINQLPPVTGYQVFVYDEKTRETGFYECNLVGTSGDRFIWSFRPELIPVFVWSMWRIKPSGNIVRRKLPDRFLFG